VYRKTLYVDEQVRENPISVSLFPSEPITKREVIIFLLRSMLFWDIMQCVVDFLTDISGQPNFKGQEIQF
jgi:hypothetical protein